MTPGDAFFGVADLGRGGPKVGFHNRGRPTDPDHVERDVAPDEVAAMRAVLAERIPGLQGRCVATTCMYTMTPDEHFVIGHLPGSDGIVAVAAGFSGHGFKFGPVVGEILADLAVDGGTDLRSPCSVRRGSARGVFRTTGVPDTPMARNTRWRTS